MPRYVVHLTAGAYTSVKVDTDATSPQDIVRAMWATNPEMPTLCHQCAGGHGEPSLELEDEWEPVTSTIPLITPHVGTAVES